ncbi:MAG TPA: hypothetical protein VL068_14410, partial [Microthrixaceae bacterium]|nr:hypothetical protein [Microthrixaceae bacterium]
MQPTDRPPTKRRTSLLRALIRAATAVAVIATTSLAMPGAASAAGLDVSGLTPINYTEGGDPVAVAPGIIITGGGTFADGYIEFGVADAQAEDRLFLPEAETPDQTKDSITVIGSAVYLGLGSGYKQIGTVNSPNDGQNGRPLRVDFSAALTNSSFDDGLTGWTVNENVVKLAALARKSQGRPVTISGSGPYTISGSGYTFKTDKNYVASGSAGWGYESVERDQSVSGGFHAEVTADPTHTTALQLWFATNCVGSAYASPYCSVFGPEAWSSPFEAKAGDDLAFDWSAAGGDDDYEVYGFLVNESAAPGTPAVDTHTELMYGRGGDQSWTTSTGKIPADGTYRFRFVTGSFDATGGLALGASLYIDNVRVLSSDATAAVAQSIGRKVHFENTGDNPRSEVSIGVSAKSSDGTSAPATIPVETTLVDDAPIVANMAGVSYTNSYGDTSFTNTTGTAVATDAEGDPITFSISGG